MILRDKTTINAEKADNEHSRSVRNPHTMLAYVHAIYGMCASCIQ